MGYFPRIRSLVGLLLSMNRLLREAAVVDPPVQLEVWRARRSRECDDALTAAW